MGAPVTRTFMPRLEKLPELAPARDSAEQGSSASPLSQVLWGFSWSDILPYRIGSEGVVAIGSTFDRALPFIHSHYAEIFHEDPTVSPFVTKVNAARQRYYRAAGDFFEFVHEGRTVGLLIGTPIDWGSYYIRSAAVLPSYQGKKIIQRFFPVLFAQLKRAGVERVEADTSPSNMATMHLLTRLRFNMTGTMLSERWGAHVHFTKFLDEASEGVFLEQFCSGVKYQRRGRTASGTQPPH
jgi:N-acetylglutamate synthase-like GNAT family acetyltransferase